MNLPLNSAVTPKAPSKRDNPEPALLRAARPDDALCLSVLAMQVFLHTYATDGIRPQIARNAGHQLAPAGVPAELLRLYVQEPFTGAKLGTQLLGRAEDIARQRGATGPWLSTPDAATPITA